MPYLRTTFCALLLAMADVRRLCRPLCQSQETPLESGDVGWFMARGCRVRAVGRSVVTATGAHAEHSSRIDAVCDTDAVIVGGVVVERQWGNGALWPGDVRRAMVRRIFRTQRRCAFCSEKRVQKTNKDKAIRTSGQWWDGRGSQKSDQPSSAPYKVACTSIGRNTS